MATFKLPALSFMTAFPLLVFFLGFCRVMWLRINFLALFCLILGKQFCASGKMAISLRKRISYWFNIHFRCLEKKDSFLLKLKVACKKLTQEGSPLLDNYCLFSTLLDIEVADPTHHLNKMKEKVYDLLTRLDYMTITVCACSATKIMFGTDIGEAII